MISTWRLDMPASLARCTDNLSPRFPLQATPEGALQVGHGDSLATKRFCDLLTAALRRP